MTSHHSKDESSCHTGTEEEESSYCEESCNSSDDDDNLAQQNLLFLCQEGQMSIARKRFQLLLAHSKEDPNRDQLRKEIFQVGSDKNYPLHEILMGGTSDTNALLLAELILTEARVWKGPFLTMLTAQPPSHQRTALHWATWGNSSLEILRGLVKANPEALVLRDKTQQGNRTPLETFRHYYGKFDKEEDSPTQQKLQFLERCTKSWTRHRLRLSVYKSTVFYFRQQHRTPFDEKARKELKIKPRPWFALSVLGDLLQREVQPLVFYILDFAGKDAKIEISNRKKRKRKGGT